MLIIDAQLWKLTCNGCEIDKVIGPGPYKFEGTSLERDSDDAESAWKSNRSKTVRPKRKYRTGDAMWRRRRPKTSVVS